MSAEVEIYRCSEDLELVETRPLLEVLDGALTRILRRDLSRAQYYLYLCPESAPEPPAEAPRVENLMPEYGYAIVFVIENDVVTYRHPHTVDEVIGRHLRRDLAQRSRETVWGYRLSGPGISRRLSRPAPSMEHAVEVERYRADETPSFRVRRVPDPDPELAALSAFNIDAEDGEFVKVMVHEQVDRLLRHERDFSHEVEEGGFLVGRVFRDAVHDGTFLVEVTGALDARHTGASLLHLTFTGDSFQDVKQTLRERPDDQLLGWYHTHLFPAQERMGLSTIDLELHFTTFHKPWQLAGLVNLERDGGRTLRFYVRREDTMDLCPQWIIPADVEGR